MDLRVMQESINHDNIHEDTQTGLHGRRKKIKAPTWGVGVKRFFENEGQNKRTTQSKNEETATRDASKHHQHNNTLQNEKHAEIYLDVLCNHE